MEIGREVAISYTISRDVAPLGGVVWCFRRDRRAALSYVRKESQIAEIGAGGQSTG
jgi:hypothetical protein